MLHTLLLTNSYEFLKFMPENRTLLLFTKKREKDEIEVLSEWDEEIVWRSGKFKLPATLRLKYPIRRFKREPNTQRNFIFRRDNYLCQYCNAALTYAEATIDHVHPRSLGGEFSWENCVTSCVSCNLFKGNRTPEQANMRLKIKPQKPKFNNGYYDFMNLYNKHSDWKYYLGIDL